MTDLEQALAAAKERYAAASKALRPKHAGGEWDEYHAAVAAMYEAERALAAARDEEYAVPAEFPVRWDIGAPLPHLVVNDHRAFLVFYLRSPDARPPLALVEFHRCISARLGGPNDEVFEGHPLSGRGLAPYTAQLVRNSRWVAELEAINRVHRGYRAEYWTDRKHYVLWFHDSTFECIAESFTVEEHACSMRELLAIACGRLVQ